LLFASEPQRQFIEIRIKHLENGISCSIVCHEDQLNKTTASTYAMWSISTHALFGVTCEKCHGGKASVTLKNDAHVGITNLTSARAETPQMCGKCHTAELNEFKNSLHFQRLESADVPAPACITCHQAHSVHVLTASEIEDFCSNCHNGITGIDPTVPKKAAQALSSVNDLRAELSKAEASIVTAKAESKDVTASEADLNSAKGILKNIPSVWHRFNLTYFETEVQKGITVAQKAENETAGIQATTSPSAKSPGFEGLLLVTGVLAVYLLRRRGETR
jgi:formate-dependent nitrite reductase cytochrome c552 subunit